MHDETYNVTDEQEAAIAHFAEKIDGLTAQSIIADRFAQLVEQAKAETLTALNDVQKQSSLTDLQQALATAKPLSNPGVPVQP